MSVRAKQSFADQREQIHHNEEETRYYEREHREEHTRPELDDTSTATLRMLYLGLVKRFHPDLAKTEDERLQRERVMKEVNAAFHERDLDRLRAIELEHQVDETAFESKSIGDKLVWAIREVSRLDNLIDSIQKARSTLEASELAILSKRQGEGEPLLARLESKLHSSIENRRELLRLLIAEFRHMTHEVQRDR